MIDERSKNPSSCSQYDSSLSSKVKFGFAAGEIPKLALNLVLLKGCDVLGVFWGSSVKRDPEGHRANMRDLLAWIAEGRLKPRIHGTSPLDEIKSAIEILERREAVGKVVLTL